MSFINYRIPHIRQKRSNDCGVACTKMALSYIFGYQNRILNDNELNSILKDLNVYHKSLWTLDIAHILALYKVKHKMYTITFGVLDHYSNENFYSKNMNFDEEQRRINQKFAQLNDLGIVLYKKSLTLDEIKAEIKYFNCVCIVLIDANKLKGHNTNNATNLNSVPLRSNCFLKLMTLFKSKFSYAGHFVVLFGFDDERKIVFYRNPSRLQCVSYTTEKNFDECRKAFGTDEDIIFAYV